MIMPWITYEAFLFILEREDGIENVWEWGSGASTLYYGHLFDIISIEHNARWVKLVNDLCDEHGIRADIRFKRVGKGYEKITGKHDLVIVDGRNRGECLKNAIPHVRKYLVFDNSEREKYKEALDVVPKHWKRHDFEGTGRRDPFYLDKREARWRTTVWEVRDETVS